MNGVLVVDKPEGPSSHDVVARVRRAVGEKRIGHTGTLDPGATGVLPLVVGRATRLAQFLSGADKEYVAQVRFGFATSTYDAAGDSTPPLPGGPGPIPKDLAAAIDPLLARGSYEQLPPPFSAKKVGGTPAYKLARRNEPVALSPVPVTIRDVELVGTTADTATIRLVCSAGFYVRTFAHELGQRLGCGAHLAGLRRTRAGEFTLDHAIALAAIERDGRAGSAHLIPTDRLLPSMPAAVLTERGVRRASHGNVLTGDDVAGGVSPGGPHVKLVDGRGRLVGIAAGRAAGSLQPVVVLV